MKTEQLILRLVDGRQLEMNDQGQFWRLSIRGRTGRLVPCERARAEVPTAKGYLAVRANVGCKMQSARAHRLVWLICRGAIPDGVEINHLNGNKKDNRIENLELVTPKQNSQHALKTGLAPRVHGEQHPRCKLTTEHVSQIKARRANGEKLTRLAKEFGVSHNAISSICLGRTRRNG